MDEPLKVFMGVPERKYFYMPWSGNAPPKGQKILFIHPHTKNETAGTVSDFCRLKWVFVPDSFCIEHFHVNSARLKRNLEDNYPQFRNLEEILFILFLET